MKKKKDTKDTKEDWHYCDPCQKKRGGKEPKGGMGCITVMSGKCPMCGKVATLIPNADYIWPGKIYMWD